MNIFNRLTIGSRLWLNLFLTLVFITFVTLTSWLATHQSAQQSNQLVNKEQKITKRIAEFHKGFITTLQQSNNFVLTGTEAHGQAFNEMIDQQKKSLYSLIADLGASVEFDQSGFLAFTEEPTGKHTAIIQALFPLDRVLQNLEKSTNSNVFKIGRAHV